MQALVRKIEIFKDDFLNFSRSQYTKNNKLFHAGEFGFQREQICKDFIMSVIPKSRQIDIRGFVINSNNEISAEQDLIFYSKNDTPVLTLEKSKFYPVETVVGIGQIKSIIRTKKELKQALDELKKVKGLREKMSHSSVIWRSQDLYDGKNSFSTDNPYDQIFTFLICEKINFKISAADINNLYEEGTPCYLKHNIVLDVSSGVYAYKFKEDEPFVAMPVSQRGTGTPHFNASNTNNDHIKHFLNNLHTFIPNNTLFHPEMSKYMY